MAVHRERMLYGRRNNKHIYSLPVKAKGFYKMFRCMARKNRIARRIYHTLSDEVCSATPQMGIFKQPLLRHFKHLNSRRRLKLEFFLRKSCINGNIGKSQRGRIAHNVIKAYLQNIKIISINCKIY